MMVNGQLDRQKNPPVLLPFDVLTIEMPRPAHTCHLLQITLRSHCQAKRHTPTQSSRFFSPVRCAALPHLDRYLKR